MEFSYGHGIYVEGEKKFEGQIVLGEHKLFLRDASGDLAQTYVPVEKIERIRKTNLGLEVTVRPSIYFRYTALIKGDRQHISELVKDIVRRRGLKRRFLKNEWAESGS